MPGPSALHYLLEFSQTHVHWVGDAIQRSHLLSPPSPPALNLSSLVVRWWRICLQCRRPGFDPWVRKISWRREWLLTPVFLLGEFHGQRSLVGYSPWGCKELDMTVCSTNTGTHIDLNKLFSSSYWYFGNFYPPLRWIQDYRNTKELRNKFKV